MDIQKSIDELELIYNTLNDFIVHEVENGRADIRERLYMTMLQLKLTINALKRGTTE